MFLSDLILRLSMLLTPPWVVKIGKIHKYGMDFI